MPQADDHALIVAGPTASGKSALALALAERLGGLVINADSMQVYRELRILTARPTPEECAVVPHALYGVRPAAQAGSVAWWRGEALAQMAAARRNNRLPILCGGTGLYLAALCHGLADVPAPGEAARAEARARLEGEGAARLHAALAQVDPATAARLRPSDGQRVARAWEVWRGTGRGLAAWQAEASPAAHWRFSAIMIEPARDQLRKAIASRFAGMLAAGAVEEVRRLLSLRLDLSLPAMRAHGVPELSACLAGAISLAEATRRAELATGQYTKRQATWFRNRMLTSPERTHTIHARIAGPEQLSASQQASLIHFVEGAG